MNTPDSHSVPSAQQGASQSAAPARRAPTYHVSVVEQAVIVERGERRRKWFVRHEGSWVRVSDYPGVVLEEADDDSARCPPGIVWQRRYELHLARGTRLMAVSTFPRVRGRSTVWYLSHGLGRSELIYQQQQFVVAGNYRLVERGQMEQRLESRNERDTRARR